MSKCKNRSAYIKTDYWWSELGKTENDANISTLSNLLPGCISAGIWCLSEPQGPGESQPPPSAGTKIKSDITTPGPKGLERRCLTRLFLRHDRNSDAGVEVKVITYLDGQGLPVSNHSAQLDHRLHLRHSTLDALVNQALSEKKKQNKNVYMRPLKV